MKKTFVILMLLAVAVISCKKDRAENSVYGSWKLTNVGGGYSTPPTGPIIASDVKNEVYQFKKDGTYIKYLDGNILNKGTFTINLTEKIGDYEAGSINLTNPDFKDAFRIKPGTIVVGNAAFDGPVYEYTKIN